jgi:hypothetical protein
MNRRAFLSLSAVSPLAHLLPAYATRGEKPPPERELKADLVVIGDSLGGVTCALAAARNGLKTILVQNYDWIGGQLTSQGVPPDEHPWIEDRGCTKTYRTFRNKVRDFYRRNYPLTDAAKAVPHLNPGNGSVSKLCHEPRVALAVLLEMLAPHISAGRIRLIQNKELIQASVEGDQIEWVVIGNLLHQPNTHYLVAPYFVDATEHGDLLETANVEYVTGAESHRDTGEPHAPDKADPFNHQAFSVCYAVDYEEGANHTIEKPQGYDDFWKGYEPKLTPRWPGELLSWEVSDPISLKPRKLGFNPTGPTPAGTLNLWTYRRIIDKQNFADGRGDVCLVNWPQNDFWFGLLTGAAGGGIAEFNISRAKDLSLSLLYWMQTEAPRPDGRHGWKGLRLRPEIVGTDDGLAMAPYIRESRRIKAMFTVTENHVGTDARAKGLGKRPGEFTAEKFSDSVGVGSYRIDLHPSSGGDNYIDVSSLPFQIPLGALIPQRVENLLPACKNIGTTHITNGCYRLHPVEWNVGEAVGELVAFCVAKKRVPRQVRKDEKLLKDFQAGLVKAGFELDWPEDIAKKPR